MADAHANFAYSTLTNAPGTGGTSFIVGAGQGRLFPATPFNATVWPASVQPTLTGVAGTTAEIVRVTTIVNDTFTVTRLQEGCVTAANVAVGHQIAATITKQTLTDAENVLDRWAPILLVSTGGVAQTMASATNQGSTGSVLVFPVTIPEYLQFNQIIVPTQLSFITTAVAAASNTYSSKFGIYSMNANTLSLISSSSFSIGETINSVSLTWNYPTSTSTQGYGYGSFPAGNLTATAQMTSYIQGTRAVGLQFGGNMSLTAGMYWIGLLTQRKTGDTRSTHGLSVAGIIGQGINALNSGGTVSGPLPIGIAGSAWSNSYSHVSGWYGRHIMGFITATSLTEQAGTALPAAISLTYLGGTAANSTATVLPAITFVST